MFGCAVVPVGTLNFYFFKPVAGATGSRAVAPIGAGAARQAAPTFKIIEINQKSNETKGFANRRLTPGGSWVLGLLLQSKIEHDLSVVDGFSYDLVECGDALVGESQTVVS